MHLVMCDWTDIAFFVNSDQGQSSSASVTSSVDQQPQQTIELCQDLQLSLKTKQLLPKVIIDEL